jgi:cytochrome P450
MSILFLSVLIVLLFVWFYQRTQKPKEFPPGPPRWPIVGSLPYISGKHHNLLLGLRSQVQKFGSVLGYYIGTTPIVLVTDYDILKEICKLDSLSYRPSISPLHYFREGWETMQDSGDKNHGRAPGIVFSNGAYWREQRKFLSKNLKDFGFGKSSLETLLDEEVLKLCKHLNQESKNGSVQVSLMQPLKLVIISVLWTILFGEQQDLNDPKLVKLVNLIDDGLRVVSPQTFLGLILPDPAMTNWPMLNKWTGINLVESYRRGTNTFLRQHIKEHQQTMNENNIRGFVDRQLLEIQQTTDPNSSFFGKTGYYAMFNNVADIFLAGQDTTSSSILWTFLYLLHHPEVQTKIHKELDEVRNNTFISRFNNIKPLVEIDTFNKFT